ncbi:uncharacterized protein C20orf96-like isoform X2 [Ptychodera flava]|uniref:uncharacterized protein C20orf96-like isoform X2 n=1 Tax=Ptychodera flava TaxID=63121 RepID=UPI00396A3D6F
MSGWGRRATGRIERTQFEDDELLKSLEGRVNIDVKPVEYDQWSRTGVQQLLQKQRSKNQQSSTSRTASAAYRVTFQLPQTSTSTSTAKATAATTTVAANATAKAATLTDTANAKTPAGLPQAGQIQLIVSRPGAACSSSCRHPWNKKVVNYDDEYERQRQKEIAVLQIQIKARKKSVENYRARQEQLINDNIALRQAIETGEKGTHKEVRDLLKKYERFRGAVQNLNHKFDKERETAFKALDEATEKVASDLHGLQSEVERLDEVLEKQQAELKILRSYKDKEYPVKAMKIDELQKQIERLAVVNEDEMNELESIILIEKEKFAKADRDLEHHIKSEVTEKAIGAMHETLKDMALQNMVMKKEIEEHKKKMVELQETNRQLEEEVKSLLADPKTDIRRQVYPHLYPREPKCTPDMDVVLDIPTQEWLPI